MVKNKNDFVCRTCFQKVKSRNSTSISLKNDSKSSHILEILSYCVPELDLFVVTNPVICNKCINVLEKTYKFRNMCLKNEEHILEIVNNKTANTKINLLEFCNNVEKNKDENIFNNNKINVNGKSAEGDDSGILDVEDISGVDESIINKSDVPESSLIKEKYIEPSLLQKESSLNFEQCDGCLNKSSNPIFHLKIIPKLCECFHCGKKYDIQNLRKHMMKHCNLYKCDICGKHCRDRNNLRVHLRTHTGARPFECEWCKQCFQQKYTLTQHLQKHAGAGSNKCGICDKVFSTSYNLKIHLLSRNVHDVPYRKRARRKLKYSCESCGLKFTSKKELKIHATVCFKIEETVLEDEYKVTEEYLLENFPNEDSTAEFKVKEESGIENSTGFSDGQTISKCPIGADLVVCRESSENIIQDVKVENFIDCIKTEEILT